MEGITLVAQRPCWETLLERARTRFEVVELVRQAVFAMGDDAALLVDNDCGVRLRGPEFVALLRDNPDWNWLRDHWEDRQREWPRERRVGPELLLSCATGVACTRDAVLPLTRVVPPEPVTNAFLVWGEPRVLVVSEGVVFEARARVAAQLRIALRMPSLAIAFAERGSAAFSSGGADEAVHEIAHAAALVRRICGWAEDASIVLDGQKHELERD